MVQVLKGLEGFLLGLVAGTINLGGLWLGIKMFAVPDPRSTPTNQAVLIAIACFVKMPVFIAAGFLTWRIGIPAPACFLVAVGLVYSVLIWWVSKPR